MCVCVICLTPFELPSPVTKGLLYAFLWPDTQPQKPQVTSTHLQSSAQHSDTYTHMITPAEASPAVATPVGQPVAKSLKTDRTPTQVCFCMRVCVLC